ncbi:hypothetical protein H5410_045573 [Solanum commersonii]|uniref:Uncharacterized protein n=1 Tax=Solanum commersonii TaxID=4109 RepID=A0A9J5X9Y8_SOLCO|nr:hypothetical protein H5410_045573 [Solanum commersonii]
MKWTYGVFRVEGLSSGYLRSGENKGWNSKRVEGDSSSGYLKLGENQGWNSTRYEEGFHPRYNQRGRNQGTKRLKEQRNEGPRIAESTWRVAEGSYFTFCSSVLSPKEKDQVGEKRSSQRIAEKFREAVPYRTMTQRMTILKDVCRHEVQLDRVNPSLIPTHSVRESEWVKA